ncbi:unnamed protein product [Nippostrongylus brasiliensis]|uniref:Hexosyltransferase n=1 Tax=Nippostrongylus brasiliensis TaxID=27835 RepID=A0A0N4XQ57_NIPBR|nr:unnamed protein product [Nippostrongylus brasiliensis]
MFRSQKFHVLFEFLLLILLVVVWLNSVCRQDKPNAQEYRWSEKLSGPPSVVLSLSAGHCSNRDYLIVLYTKVSEPAVRESFRNTYGLLAEKFNFGTLFPLGLSSSDDVNANVSREHETHDDILVGNYLDTYRNLTLKVSVIEPL